MINIKVVNVLKKNGFDMSKIKAALHEAEKNRIAELDGWLIRYDRSGEMIVLHPDWCGIYVGDYESHISFRNNLSYHYGNCGYMSAQYGKLKEVLNILGDHRNGNYILGECYAGEFEQRKRQIEKAGYSVYKSNISACTKDWSTCFFLIA